jgi:multidrug efflux pump subunit AcrA (membrane-fusion protein)
MKVSLFAFSIFLFSSYGTSCFSADQKSVVGIPVTTSHVVQTNLAVFVSGPGKTVALESQKVLSPFPAILLTLNVADGDQVHAKEVIGTLLSSDSVAALEGAQQMLQSAHTLRERSDARLAVKIAKRSGVKYILRAAEEGVVVSHEADEGARVAQDQVLVTIAATDSIVFLAEIDQTHLSAIHSGLPAFVNLAGNKKPIAGNVHAVLPAGTSTDLRSPVRIDLNVSQSPTLGVFGTVQIQTEVHRNTFAVPEAALLRNDVHGTTKIAVVAEGNHAKWIEVKTGVSERGLVEILSPQLKVGETVITDGQVGLPDESLVRIKQ